MANLRGVAQESAANIALQDNQRLEWYRQLWNNRGAYNETGFLVMQTLAGNVQPTDTWNMFSTEQDFVDLRFEVASISVPAAAPGDPVTVVLTAASHDPVTDQAMIQETDILTIGVSRGGSYLAVQGQVTNVVYTPGANVVTITPSSATTDFSPGGANEMTAGTELTILSNSQIEGGDSRRSITSSFLKYDVQHQIMRWSFSATGSAMAIGTQIADMAGAGDSQVMYDLMLRERDALVQTDGALLTQSSVTGSPYGSTFDGLVPTIVNRGGILTSTPGGGAYTRAYVEGLAQQIAASGGVRHYTFMRGLGNMFSWNAVLNDFPAGSVRYAEPIKGDAMFDIGTQLDTLTIAGGFKFSTMEMKRWTHPNLEGAPSVGDYYNAAVGIPNGKLTAQGSTGGYFRVLFLSGHGENRRSISWSYGGMAPNRTNGVDARYYETLSEIGPQYFGVNNFVFERNS